MAMNNAAICYVIIVDIIILTRINRGVGNSIHVSNTDSTSYTDPPKIIMV